MAKPDTAANTPLSNTLQADLDRLAVACRILEMEGHASRQLGHMAMRDPDGRGFWLKRRGISFAETRDASDFILVDFDGNVLAGEGLINKEWPIHAEILKCRPDINVTAHSHPFHGRVFSASTEPLRPVSNAGSWFPDAPPRFTLTSELVCTPDVAAEMAKCLGDARAMFLRNHGVVFCGDTIERATLAGIQLEEACREQLAIAASGLKWEWPDAEERARKNSNAGPPQSLGIAFDYYARKLAQVEAQGGLAG